MPSRIHSLFACGSPKHTLSSWFCSRTVHAPVKPKPLRSQSTASKPRIVRRAVLNERKPPIRGRHVLLDPEVVALNALLHVFGDDGGQDHGRPPKREVPCGFYGQRGVNETRLRQPRKHRFFYLID
jgi:hypothetical protein